MGDMTKDVFAEHTFGKLALKKMGQVPGNFRLYIAGMYPEPPKEWQSMKVTGAEFREAKKGPSKGKLAVLIPGTQRTVHVPRLEIEQFDQQG